MVKQFFIPTFLGVLLFIWLVIVQVTSFRVSAMTGPSGGGSVWSYTQITFGFPPVLEIRPGNQPAVRVYWKNVAMVWAAAYALAMPLGRWISGYRVGEERVGPVRTGWRRPGVVVLMVFAGCSLVGLIIGVLLLTLDANMRGLNWLEIWWGLTLMAMILFVPFTLIVMVVRRFRWRRAYARRRGFAVEMVT